MQALLLLLTTLLIGACTSQSAIQLKNQTQTSAAVETPYTNLLPLPYVFPQMPFTIGILQADGKVTPHPKVKSYAVRFEIGKWSIQGKRLVISYQTFNAFGCEDNKVKCSHVSPTRIISLDLDEKGAIKDLRTFVDTKHGFEQLYYQESVVKDAPSYFE